MHASGRVVGVAVGLLLGGAPDAGAQEPGAGGETLAVYLDCQTFGCDQTFFRTEITWVNWVLDRESSAVHLLVTAQAAGGGGRLFNLAFIGRGRFDGDATQLEYASSGDATQDEVRGALAERIKLGLVRYAALTPAAERLRVQYQAPGASAPLAAAEIDDPWDFWVITLRINGFANGESSSSFFSINGSANASRVTEGWKLDFGVNFNRNRNRFDLSDSTLIAIQRNWGMNGLAVKSLTGHWSAGLRVRTGSSTYDNQDLFVEVAPGLEYNVFPYAESTRRALTFQYLVSANHYEWADTTIYDRISETRPRHSLTGGVQMNQPWGQVRVSLTGNQYLHDLSKYGLELGGNVQWRIFRGLSLNFGGNYEWVRDQLQIPAGELSDDEILTRQQQLATAFRYFTNFGLSYRFGSIYNNVVNPRFGGGGQGQNFF